MTATKATGFSICTDCALIIAYDDWTILDGSYTPARADQRELAIRAGLKQHGALAVDMGEPIQHSALPSCDCCGVRTDGTLWPAHSGRQERRSYDGNG